MLPSTSFGLLIPVNWQIPANELSKHLYCEVIVFLGAPELECAGHGVCRVFPPSMVGLRNRSCPNGFMRVVVSDSGKIQLHFDKNSFKKTVRTHHFQQGVFRVDSAFSFPKFVLRRLGITKGEVILLPGNYTCVDTGKDWVITL